MHCGVSGDCLFWVHVFKAIGALPGNIDVPKYRRQEALGDSMLTLRTRIEATGRAASCLRGEEPFLIGDVLLFRNGMSGAHCGLVVKSAPVHFAHLSQAGFTEEPLNQKHWLDSLAYVYRLLEESGQQSSQPSALSIQPAGSHQPAVVAAIGNRGPVVADSRQLKADSCASEARP